MEAEEGRVSRLVFPSDCDRTSVVAALVAIGVITTRLLAFSACENLSDPHQFSVLHLGSVSMLGIIALMGVWRTVPGEIFAKIPIDAQVIERFWLGRADVGMETCYMLPGAAAVAAGGSILYCRHPHQSHIYT